MSRTSGGRRDWLPSNRAARVAMARVWIDVFVENGAAWNISTAEVNQLRMLAANSDDANARVDADLGSRVLIAEANQASDELGAYMRQIRRTKLFTPPLTPANFIALNLTPHDNIRTPHINVTEMVDFVIHLSNIRELSIDFWIQGEEHRAKPKDYDGAVIIWKISDFAPSSPDDFHGHTMASRTPHTLTFEETERGLTVWIALAWQNERGNLGQWSEFKSAVIP